MRTMLIPACMTLLVVVAMAYQAKTVEPVLCDPPAVRLPEMDGYSSESFEPSEAELTVLPSDTMFDKRLYHAADGACFRVSLVIGGRSKSSIHRPELCLPSQGFQMMRPRTVRVGAVDWRLVDLAARDAPSTGFAYAFFNQEGFRTSSHLCRIFRDVWDRSFRGQIDRWAMVTVHASVSDERRMRSFLSHLKGVFEP